MLSARAETRMSREKEWGKRFDKKRLIFDRNRRRNATGVDFDVGEVSHLHHAYQSLACETAIVTDFRQLFSLK